MDQVDISIIRLLEANARISAADIGRRVHLSLPAVTERLRKLGESGIIESYTIRLSQKGLGLRTTAFVKVWVEHTEAENLMDNIAALEEVLECHHIAGDYDLLLKVRVRGTSELEQLLVQKLKKLMGVTRTSTTIVLGTYKEKINRLLSDEAIRSKKTG